MDNPKINYEVEYVLEEIIIKRHQDFERERRAEMRLMGTRSALSKDDRIPTIVIL